MTKAIDIERVAAEIHEFYFRLYGGFLPADYDELPEFMKDDNRAAARRIGAVLSVAGLCLAPRDGKEWSKDEQEAIRAVIEESIEILAEAEHDGWVETRLRQGWRLASNKPTGDQKRANFDQRLHHLLISYHDLPESEKTKDRDVRNYVDIISRTDYRIVPRSQS